MKKFLFLLTILVFSSTGCGYTTKTALPDHIRSVHVPSVTNKIDISSEISGDKEFQVYRPGLEVELRNALIDRLIFDGHLRVDSKEKADSVIQVELLEFDREPLRYNSNDTIQEFRIFVRASVQFVDQSTGQIIWARDNISGDSSYFLSGQHAVTEDEAVDDALEDLSRQIIENILEVW